jgi:hypothetical protein
MRKQEISRTAAVLATLMSAAMLTACVGPTPYRAAGAEGNNFGYASSKLSDQLYRVRFTGSTRTPVRWADAFMLYRSAQVAKEAAAPAFKIVEGTIDTTVLTGEDIFGQGRSHADVEVSKASQATQGTQPDSDSDSDSDRVVGLHDPYMRQTAGAMPVFRAPPPAPRVSSQPPLFIYMPSSGAGYAPQGRSILVELRSDLNNLGEQTFVTDDVLGRLGPRIKRAGQATETKDVPAPSSAS